MIAAGEQWPDGGLRPSVEDLIGAGAILTASDPATLSPEARAAVAAFRTVRARLDAALGESASGRELVAAGFGVDVQLAAELDATDIVPVLVDGAFGGGDGMTWPMPYDDSGLRRRDRAGDRQPAAAVRRAARIRRDRDRRRAQRRAARPASGRAGCSASTRASRGRRSAPTRPRSRARSPSSAVRSGAPIPIPGRSRTPSRRPSSTRSPTTSGCPTPACSSCGAETADLGGARSHRLDDRSERGGGSSVPVHPDHRASPIGAGDMGYLRVPSLAPRIGVLRASRTGHDRGRSRRRARTDPARPAAPHARPHRHGLRPDRGRRADPQHRPRQPAGGRAGPGRPRCGERRQRPRRPTASRLDRPGQDRGGGLGGRLRRGHQGNRHRGQGRAGRAVGRRQRRDGRRHPPRRPGAPARPGGRRQGRQADPDGSSSTRSSGRPSPPSAVRSRPAASRPATTGPCISRSPPRSWAPADRPRRSGSCASSCPSTSSSGWPARRGSQAGSARLVDQFGTTVAPRDWSATARRRNDPVGHHAPLAARLDRPADRADACRRSPAAAHRPARPVPDAHRRARHLDGPPDPPPGRGARGLARPPARPVRARPGRRPARRDHRARQPPGLPGGVRAPARGRADPPGAGRARAHRPRRLPSGQRRAAGMRPATRPWPSSAGSSRATLRPTDRAFRTGGDEFALLLPGATGEAAAAVARRLLASSMEARPGRGEPGPRSFSAGVSAYPAMATDRRRPHGPGRRGPVLGEAPRPDERRAVRSGPPPAVRLGDAGRRAGLDRGGRGHRPAAPAAGLPADRRSRRPAGSPARGPDPADARLGLRQPGRAVRRPPRPPGGRRARLRLPRDRRRRRGRHRAPSRSSPSTCRRGRSRRTTSAPARSSPLVRKAGLDPTRIVLELTEREQVEEMERLRRNVDRLPGRRVPPRRRRRRRRQRRAAAAEPGPVRHRQDRPVARPGRRRPGVVDVGRRGAPGPRPAVGRLGHRRGDRDPRPAARRAGARGSAPARATCSAGRAARRSSSRSRRAAWTSSTS